MERCGFFDAELVGEEYDRSYLAEQFAAYFASFIGNGVFAGRSSELLVAASGTSMQVKVLSGQGWINGYWYENTSELPLQIDVADGVLDRIDSIVLRLGLAERHMWIEVKKGVPSNSPLAPELVRNADYYDLQLAEVYVKAGALSIRQLDVFDTRFDSRFCGLVASTVDHIDTSMFGLQLRAWLALFREESVEEVNNLISQLEALIEEGDLGQLFIEIQNLKNLSIESEHYPGCYFRGMDGETEWLNPPLEPGVEYRLTERFEGKPVYKMLVHVASLPDTSLTIITPDLMLSKIVSIEGTMFDSADSYTEIYPFPVFRSNGVTPDAIIYRAMPGLEWTNIAIMTMTDLTGYKADIVIKYVK